MIQRWGKVYGRGFTLRSWQERFLKVEKDHSKSHRAFQRNFQKTFFSSEKHFGLSRNKKENF